MAVPVKRSYDNSRRLAQVRATRLRVLEAAKALFIENGYPATTLESVADAADVSLPTLYRLFGSKRALLSGVIDTSFGGDDDPIAFGERPRVQAARNEADPIKLVEAFGPICADLMERSSAILHVLASAAPVDSDAADLLAEIRHQRHTGQSRIVAALVERGALDPSIDPAHAADLLAEIRDQRHTGQSRIVAALVERGALDPNIDPAHAADMVYAWLSPDVHRILTIERGWTQADYELWVIRCLKSLLC